MGTLTIRDHQISDQTYDQYDVTFHGEEILTLVTSSPHMVDSWISATEYIHRFRLNRLVVGLDVEWRPSFTRYVQNPVATIQLCVGRRCLIFQPIHAPYIPQSLSDFLSDDRFTFVGVGIGKDAEKLVANYDLSVGRRVDLSQYAANVLNRSELRNVGLKELTLQVLGKEIQKERNVTLSDWDEKFLTFEQVAYACVDAFVCFDIGRVLRVWKA